MAGNKPSDQLSTLVVNLLVGLVSLVLGTMGLMHGAMTQQKLQVCCAEAGIGVLIPIAVAVRAPNFIRRFLNKVNGCGD